MKRSRSGRQRGGLPALAVSSAAQAPTHGVPDFTRQREGHALIAMSDALGKVPDVDWLPQIASTARVVVRTNGREPMAPWPRHGVARARTR